MQEVQDTLLRAGETVGGRVGCLVSIGAGRAAAQGRSSGGGGSSSSGGSANSSAGGRRCAAGPTAGGSGASANSRRQREGEGDDMAAREAERSASWFERENDDLIANGQYFRFNVDKGLENVGLDQALQRTLLVGATRNYLRQQEVRDEVEACAKSLEDCGRGFM